MAKRESDQIRDDVLRRMLKTPPKKHEPLGERKPKAPTQEELERLARDSGQDDPNAKLNK